LQLTIEVACVAEIDQTRGCVCWRCDVGRRYGRNDKKLDQQHQQQQQHRSKGGRRRGRHDLSWFAFSIVRIGVVYAGLIPQAGALARAILNSHDLMDDLCTLLPLFPKPQQTKRIRIAPLFPTSWGEETTNNMNARRTGTRTKATVYRVQLYGIFVTAIGWLSLLHVLGYVRLLRHHDDNGDNDETAFSSIAGPFGRIIKASSSSRQRRTAVVEPPADTDSGLTSQKSQTRRSSDKNGRSLSSSHQDFGGGSWSLYQLALSADMNGTGFPDGAGAGEPGHDDFTKISLLSRPQEIFLNYLRHHSAAALRSDSPEAWRRRRFAVTYYSCPHQLGNRLFLFMNNLLWAIITNRTVLYQYLDRETCERLMVSQPLSFLDCRAANVERDCDAVLERSTWLPSYEEFADPSWSTTTTIHQVEFWQTHWSNVSDAWVRDRYRYDAAKHTNLTKVDKINATIVNFPALTNYEIVDLLERDTRQNLLATTDARMTARKLVHHGLRYAYGMFLAETFRLRQEHVEMVKDYYDAAKRHDNNETDVVFSIALHSRHKFVKQKGRNIQMEKDCLNKVLVHRAANQPCQVCAMSDRTLALTKLKSWLEKEHRGCQMITVDHSSTETSFSVEHGRHAGAGFARELDLCYRYGRDAVVTTSTGSGASSSALLEALADYHHRNNRAKSSGVDYSNKTVETQFCSDYST
jgi:hypothetical protein